MKPTLIAKAVCVVVMGGFLGTAEAQFTYDWTAATDNFWGTANNWDPRRDNPHELDRMYVQKQGGSTCIYRVGDQTVQSVSVQRGNSIQHDMSERTLKITSQLTLGHTLGEGAYNLSNGSLIVRDGSPSYLATVAIGNGSGQTGSAGHFVQSGGSAGFDWLLIGNYVEIQGTSSYTLSGGSVTARRETVGVESEGLFKQSGGAHTVTLDLILGGPTGGGHYEMSGGTLSVAGEALDPEHHLYVGYYGSGRFIHTGGTVTIKTVEQAGQLLGGSLYVGRDDV